MIKFITEEEKDSSTHRKMQFENLKVGDWFYFLFPETSGDLDEIYEKRSDNSALVVVDSTGVILSRGEIFDNQFVSSPKEVVKIKRDSFKVSLNKETKKLELKYPEQKKPPTFGDVKELQFFVAVNGSLFRKESPSWAIVIANKEGLLVTNLSTACMFSSDEVIKEIKPFVNKVEF